MTTETTTSKTTAAATKIVVIEAGISDPSSTRMLADRITDRIRRQDPDTHVTAVRLGPLAVDIARAITSGFPVGDLAEAIDRVSAADALVVATPVYKAGMSGLMKSFLDILDDDAINSTPVLLAATAGTVRHSLVIDQQIRPVFSYLRAYLTPTAVFQAPDDWADNAVPARIGRAVDELLTLTGTGATRRAAKATVDAAGVLDYTSTVDFDSDLMRLAIGGLKR